MDVYGLGRYRILVSIHSIGTNHPIPNIRERKCICVAIARNPGMVARKSGNHSQNRKVQTNKILHCMTIQIEDATVVVACFLERHTELYFLAEISSTVPVCP